MTSAFAPARAAAHAAAAQQHYPQGSLYLVATPIGNLADISLRALHVLHLVDSVACEDTRHTQTLLRAYGIDKTAGQLLALHQHNEAEAAAQVVELLRQGRRVAYVSDAGTPAVSDPGAALVAAVRAAGHACVPLPGASSVVAALSVAGDTLAQGFAFVGFAPAKAAQRQAWLDALAARRGEALVMFETPHRIEALADALARAMPGRPLTVARELTKQFETVHTLGADALPAWLAADPNRLRGEFVLVLHALPDDDAAGALDASVQRTLALLLAELPLKQAVSLAAAISGAPRNLLYQHALAQRGEAGKD